MLIALPTAMAQMPEAPQAKHFPWSDASLSPDQHADPVIKEMTLDENISLLHGQDMPLFSKGPTDSNGGAGYTATIPRLGIPSIQMVDSAYGVTRGDGQGIRRRCPAILQRRLPGIQRPHSSMARSSAASCANRATACH